MATDYNVLGPFNSCMGDRMKAKKEFIARPDGNGGYWWWHRKYPHVRVHLEAKNVCQWPKQGLFSSGITQKALAFYDGRAVR